MGLKSAGPEPCVWWRVKTLYYLQETSSYGDGVIQQPVWNVWRCCPGLFILWIFTLCWSSMWASVMLLRSTWIALRMATLERWVKGRLNRWCLSDPDQERGKSLSGLRVTECRSLAAWLVSQKGLWLLWPQSWRELVVGSGYAWQRGSLQTSFLT